MNADPRSTSEVILIAKDVVNQQARVCEMRQDNLEERVRSLTETAQANVEAVTAVNQAVALLAQTVKPLPGTVKEHGEHITKLKLRPAVWAFFGAAIPTAADLILSLFNK